MISFLDMSPHCESAFPSAAIAEAIEQSANRFGNGSLIGFEVVCVLLDPENRSRLSEGPRRIR